MHILQVTGEIIGFSLFNICHGRIQRHMAGVGFWRSCHQHSRVTQGDSSFGHAQLQRHIHTGIDNGDDHGVSKAHILRCDHHKAAAGGLHLSNLQKPGQIVNRRIRVRTTDGFLQGRQKVIVGIPVPVSPHGTFLGDGFGISHGERQDVPFGNTSGEQHFDGIHGFAQVSAATGSNVFQCAGFGLRREGSTLFKVGNCTLYCLQGCRSRDLLEFKNRGTAENRIEHIEIGILCGGSDEGDLAVFDMLQKGLLLLLIERLDLI